MSSPGENSHSRKDYFLPLFRSEALAAKERLHGDVVLIRPLSVAVLSWTLVAITLVGISFLAIGHYDAFAVVPAGLAQSQPASPPQATFYSSSTWTQLQVGSDISLLWQNCGQQQRIRAKLISLTTARPGQDQISQPDSDPELNVRAVVELPREFSGEALHGGRLDAEVPIGRRPLIHWFFARRNS